MNQLLQIFLSEQFRKSESTCSTNGNTRRRASNRKPDERTNAGVLGRASDFAKLILFASSQWGAP
jgi:hypothetical protein